MSSHAITGSAMSAIVAGVIAAVIYEVLFFLTSSHQVRAGLPAAAVIGGMTVLIAFVVGLIFWQVFHKRS